MAIDRLGPGAPAPSPPPRRRAWWLGVELAVFAALAVLAVPSLATLGSDVRDQAAERAAGLIQQLSPAQHHDHGHTVTGNDNVVCGVDVFGTEPRAPASVDDVRTVYGYYFCAIGPDGTPYDGSSRSDGPVVVTLRPVPSVRIPGQGAGYEQRVRDLMPDEYEPLCFGGLRDQSVALDVRRRYIELAGAG
jgi:hypothetical protein